MTESLAANYPVRFLEHDDTSVGLAAAVMDGAHAARGEQPTSKPEQAILRQQEEANARFQKVLDTWERQQREYQTYLDSLKPGHQ